MFGLALGVDNGCFHELVEPTLAEVLRAVGGVVRFARRTDWVSQSGDAKSFVNRVRCAVDHQKVGSRWPFWFPLSLLPVTQCIDAETESRRKRLLRHPQLRADCLDINVSGHVNPIAFLRLTLGVCDRLFKTSADAVACPAHDFRLLYHLHQEPGQSSKAISVFLREIGSLVLRKRSQDEQRQILYCERNG